MLNEQTGKRTSSFPRCTHRSRNKRIGSVHVGTGGISRRLPLVRRRIKRQHFSPQSPVKATAGLKNMAFPGSRTLQPRGPPARGRVRSAPEGRGAAGGWRRPHLHPRSTAGTRSSGPPCTRSAAPCPAPPRERVARPRPAPLAVPARPRPTVQPPQRGGAGAAGSPADRRGGRRSSECGRDWGVCAWRWLSGTRWSPFHGPGP